MNTTYSIKTVEEMRPEIRKLLEQPTEIASRYYAANLDRYMMIHVRTKPRFIPRRLWYRTLSRFLRLYEFQIPHL